MPITGVKEMPSEVGGVTRIILLSLDDDLAPGRGKLIAVSGSATGMLRKPQFTPAKSDSIGAVAFTHPRLGHG
jgi:hypothetical protein